MLAVLASTKHCLICRDHFGGKVSFRPSMVTYALASAVNAANFRLSSPLVYCKGTMQGTVMGAAQMLTQGFKNCNNFQDRDSAPGKRHGLPNRLQTSSYAARKILSTEKASSRFSSKIVWKSDRTGLAAILFQKSSVRRHQKTCSGDNPNSSSNIALGIAYLTPQMCLRYLS